MYCIDYCCLSPNSLRPFILLVTQTLLKASISTENCSFSFKLWVKIDSTLSYDPQAILCSKLTNQDNLNKTYVHLFYDEFWSIIIKKLSWAMLGFGRNGMLKLTQSLHSRSEKFWEKAAWTPKNASFVHYFSVWLAKVKSIKGSWFYIITKRSIQKFLI